MARMGTPLVDQPLQALTFAVVDVETTGLDPAADDVVEIAVVRVRGDGTGRTELSTLVRTDAPQICEWVHGIGRDEVQAAPLFEQVAGRLRDRLSGAVVAGHNVAFDMAFLTCAFERCGRRLPQPPQACTIELADVLGLEEGRHRLARACAAYGIKLAERHRALGDARATCDLLLHYLDVAAASGATTLRQLAREGTPSCGTWVRPVLARAA